MKQQILSNDEIDIKDIFKTILRYKISIIFIALLFLISSAVFAYYKQNIYVSTASVSIKQTSKSNSMLDALSRTSSDIENEISMMQSKFVVQKALEKLDLTIRFFSINKVNKKMEYYKNSPFLVNAKIFENDIYGKDFELIPIDDNSFNLIIKPISKFSIKSILAKLGLKSLSKRDKIEYNKIHKYGEEITNPWFILRVNKILKMPNSKYIFNFISINYLYDNYAYGLSANILKRGSSIVDIRFEDTVALRAEEILNTVVTTYINQGIAEKTKAAKLTLGFIDSQLDNINKKLKKSETNLQNYKVDKNVVDLTGKVASTSAKVTETEAKLLALETEINILSNLQTFIRTNANLSGLTIGTMNFTNQSIAAQVVILHEMVKKKEELSSDFTELHPEMQKLSRSIASSKISIRLLLKNTLIYLHQRKLDLNKILQKYNRSLESLPEQQKELAQLARPLKVNQKIYEYLLQKKAETAILKSSTISNARVLENAKTGRFIKPNRGYIIVIGLIIGLIIGMGLAFLREFLINTIKNAEDVEKITSIPIYGVIPLKKDKLTENIFTESFRSIRTNLQFLPGDKNTQIISITSSVSGEGKTTITAALSDILAQGGKKVIMLDLDMRKASLHNEFSLHNNVGITDYLTKQSNLKDVIKETGVDNLYIITTGQLPPNPSELILSLMFTELLEILRKKYDYIVIDTPPAGLVTDSVIIMNYSDITFLVAKADYTKKEFIKNLDRLVTEHATNRVGLILNGTQVGSKYGSGYGSSYAYGYGNSQYYKDRV